MSLAVTSRWVAGIPAPNVLGRYRSRFAVAGIAVDIWGASPELVDLGAQMQSFASDSETPEDIEVQVEWGSGIQPTRARELFHSGCLWSVHEFGDGFLFDFTTAPLGPRPYKRLLVDAEFRHARVVLSQECLTAENSRALEYPLDELLITHYLSLGHGVEFHGCGIVRNDRDGGSFLFVGHSGAGKSTTARLWSENVPVEVLSDDRIIVRPALARAAKGVEKECPTHTFLMHGTPWHGEAAFASPARAPLRRIFLLEHGSENRIERLSRSAAVGELLARSFIPFYQSRFVDPVLALLEEIVESVPCYRFHFVPDKTAVEKILEFHD